MRPTLIQQKPMFGQEPMAALQPATGFSRGELLGIWFGAFFVGIICAARLLGCGLARGLGHFAFPVLICLAPWVVILLFRFLICRPVTGVGKWNLWTRIPWSEMVGVLALMLGVLYLQHIAWIFWVLFLSFVCIPQSNARRWSRPTSVPSVGLTGMVALLVAIYFLPQFVTRNRRPWLIPGPAPAARTYPQALPTMTGTWRGYFGREDDPALLVVTWQNGLEFRGALLVRGAGYTAKVAVMGHLDPSGTVDVQEIRALDEPYYHGWALGIDTGSLSPNALEIRGTGVDTRQSHYDWNFRHVSTTPYLPKN